MENREIALDRIKWIKNHLEHCLEHLHHLKSDIGKDDPALTAHLKQFGEAFRPLFSYVYDIGHGLEYKKTTPLSKQLDIT